MKNFSRFSQNKVLLGVLLAGSMLFLGMANAADEIKMDIGAAFSQSYQEWLYYRKSIARPGYTEPIVYYDHVSFQKIVDLGVPALPLIVAQTQKDDMLGYAICLITKSPIHIRSHRLNNSGKVALYWTVDELPDIRSYDRPDARIMVKRWWEEFVPSLPSRYKALSEKWKKSRIENKQAEAKEHYAAMKELGVLILPQVVEEIKAGEANLIPLASELANHAIDSHATKEQVVAWWAKDKSKWTLPEKKKPETAPAPAPKSTTAPK